MPMKPCRKCGRSKWIYQFDDKTQRVTATCGGCGKSVTFLTKKGRKLAAGWTPPPETRGVHAADYQPIRHGPRPGAKGRELAPPWIPLDEQDAWVAARYS